MFPKIKFFFILLIAEILYFLIGIYRKFNPIPPRICFCYNQSIHHIYHSIFIAIELSNLQEEYEVVVYSTSEEASLIIEEELSAITNNVKLVKIRHPGYKKVNFNINWFVFLCRLRMHRPKAIVVTDYFDNVFRQLRLKTVWIYTGHGPENRGYSHPHIKDYDLVILPGQGDLEHIQARIGSFDNYAILGYSKFDYFHYHKVAPPHLFNDTKPVIIYNPHFDQTESSFFDQGAGLIDALSKTGKYNIIFMPHPDLARRYPALVSEVAGLPRVAIISRPKINLDYMAGADLYITDASSSVFEWLYFNKPVLFFIKPCTAKGADSGSLVDGKAESERSIEDAGLNNTKKIDWQYPSWKCGRVVEDVPWALQAIESALKYPEEFQAQREEMFKRTFLDPQRNVSKTIASFIYDKLK